MAGGLKWRGDQAMDDVIARLSAALGDIGLSVESDAKKELYKGHGVLTGTLRRSIHADSPSHNFSGDAGGGELGGKAPAPERDGDRLMIAVGSGLGYAMPVHQGHRSFSGYPFITSGAASTKPKVPGILKKHFA